MKQKKSTIFISQIVLGIVFCTNSIGQTIHLEIQGETDVLRELHIHSLKENSDSLTSLNYLKNLRSEMIEAGFLTAGFDSLTWKNDTLTTKLFAGNKYHWAQLKPGNVPEEYLSQAKYREKIYRGEPFDPPGVSKLFTKLISIAENNGFPFASLKMDSIHLKADSVFAVLNMDKSDFVVLDSVIVKGDIKTNQKYLENYIGFKKKQPFDQSLLNAIPNRIREIQFAKVIKQYELGIRPGKADIYLYLNHKKASNFDGIIGILPDNETGEILITGDIKLNLMNALKQGETINLRWQRLETNTQELNLAFAYPFIFNTPLGVAFEFDLYRQDTLYSQLHSEIGLQYFIKGGNYAKVYYENAQANVISNNQVTISDYVDSRINMFGVGLEFKNLDYKFNPTRGFFVNGDLAVGEKEILKNPDIDDAEYDDIELDSDIYNLNLLAGGFIPFGKRSTLLLRINGGYFVNENMFRNEMYRIGGLKTLRGFDEQSILASSYAIGTIEFRYILEQNSNIFLFIDQATYEDKGREEIIKDSPFGFGGGISFETNAGVFSLTYALGKQFDNPIEIRSGKIHFGFISFF